MEVTKLSSNVRNEEIARLLKENKHLRQSMEEQNAQLSMIQSVQEGLAAKLDVQAIYDLVGDKIREIFHDADAEIRIYDPKTNLIRFPYFTDMGERIAMDPIPLDVGISSYLLRTRKTLVINENLTQEMEKYGAKILPGGHPAKSAVFVPLMVNNQARGLLVLGNVEREHAFSDVDVRLFETLANSMSTALENARLFDETKQRAAELAIINSVQDGLASKLDVQAIYDLVGDKIRDIFHAQGTAIYLFDHKTEILDTPYCYLKKRFEIESRPFSEHPIAKLMIGALRPIIYHNLEEYRALGGAVLENSEEYKSGMYVPLLVGKEIKGMVGVANLDKENAYNDSDLRLLQTLANSMSVALENARLFDETQRLLTETEERNAELAIINSVQAGLAEGLASKRDMQAIYDLVGDKIRELFPNTDTEIRIYDPKTNLFHVPYYIENGQRLAADPISLSDATMSAHVLRTGQTLVINENIFQEMEKYGAKMMLGRRFPAKSVVFVPLLVGDHARGLIILSNVEREHAFSPSDVRLFETLANSMSTALENARLFNEVQKKNAVITEALERETASNDILRVIAESPTDIQPVLEVIARNAAQLSGLNDAIITLRDGDILRVDAHYGDIPTFPVGEGFRFNRDSVAGRAILEGRPLQAIHNQEGVKSEYPEGDKVAKKYGYRMSCAVPLMREGKAIGAISIRRLKPELLTEKQIALIQPFANQAAIAVENVRLFNETTRLLKETERRAAELAIINSVQEGLSSKLDMQAIYDLVGDKISEIFKAPAVFISTYDLAANRAYYPYYSVERKRISLEPRPPSGAALEIIRTRQPVFLQHDAEKRLVEEYKMPTIPGTPDAESYLLMPMIVGNHVKGGIGVMSTDRQHPLDDSSVRLLQTIASSMSVALENARLFDETQHLLKETEQRAAELAIINSIQEGLASKLDMQAIYDLVGDKIRDLFNTQAILIVTLDPANRTREIKYFCETGQRYYTSELFPYNQLTEYLIATKKTLVINQDAEAQIAELEMVVISKTFKSAVFIPLIAGGEVKGFITIQNLEQENAFSDSDVNLLSTFAASMSVALENARLFDETQRLLKETEQRAAELAIINSVQEGLASKLDMQAIYDLVGDKIRDLFNPHHLWILTFDPAARVRRVRYSFEKGQRYYVQESFPYNKLTEYLIATKKPLVINQNFTEAIARFEMADIIGTLEDAKSVVYIPIMAGEEVKGFISLQNIDRENAFSESDVNLLSTFASSMSITLENIRLFDETQRLLKETEQRAAELSIITSVQQGLSSKLEMQAIYELVGDEMQEIFDAESLLIVTFDHSTEMAHVTYNREKGIRYYSEPYPFTGLNRYLIQSGRTLLINENLPEWQAKLDMVLLPGTEIPKSTVFVPLTSGKKVSGFISLQNLEHEHAFSEMHVRLLETLASSMSVALENASLFDETQRLFLEAKEARTAAEQANQAKSAFLSSMSHELRTPLNAIINFVEMVARGMIGPVNQEQVELLDQTLDSSKHLLNLINDVLDISKIQAGQLTLFIEDQVSVQVELEAALNIAGGLLQEKGLQLIRDIDPHLPLVSCDRRRLRQVLLNLISNAIKFTQKGTVTVSVKNQGQEVLFGVIDTGFGIPFDKQDLIFEPFLQAENGERQMHGTGLGLPISRSLVRAHGGELWVDSQPGEGSAFFFTLPVDRSAP